MDHDVKLGSLITDGERRRDAIHICVAPVTAACYLEPGHHVGFVEPGNTELVGPCRETIGIVDPYLREAVEPGQRFWLCLYPYTITSLRHAWTHNAFTAAAAQAREINRGGTPTP
jgi:hypothetical protein